MGAQPSATMAHIAETPAENRCRKQMRDMKSSPKDITLDQRTSARSNASVGAPTHDECNRTLSVGNRSSNAPAQIGAGIVEAD